LDHNEVTIGVAQFACSDDAGENLATASRLVRQAAQQGANVVLVQDCSKGSIFARRNRLFTSHGRSHSMITH
jgi:N-carbamoylputrescine amidase